MSKRTSGSTMGSLDKLGILVIVILVVVVGVVVITPKDRMDQALGTVEDYVQADQPHEARELDLPPVEDDKPEQPRWAPSDTPKPEDPVKPVDPTPEPEKPHVAEVPKPVEPVVVKPVVKPTPVAAKSVTVRKGDSLYAIAARELGDGNLWPRIVDANPGVDADSLQVGQVLRLPSAGATNGTRTVQADPPKPEARPSAARTYTVVKGDTLSTISSKHYGTSKRWKDIQRANADVLGGTDRVLVGMELVIPAAGATETRSANVRRDAPAPASGRTYRVRKSDSLWTIAARELGDGSRWREILDLNRDSIRNEQIQVDQVLSLPTR